LSDQKAESGKSHLSKFSSCHAICRSSQFSRWGNINNVEIKSVHMPDTHNYICPNKCYVHIPVHLSSVGIPTQPSRSLKYTFSMFKLATPSERRGLPIGLPLTIT